MRTEEEIREKLDWHKSNVERSEIIIELLEWMLEEQENE